MSISIINPKEVASLKAVEKRLNREIVFTKVPTGREICEKQLFNFIDVVERVEIDTDEIESFLPNVYKKLGWMSREELIQRFVSVEFNRFLSYYKDSADLENAAAKQTFRDDKNVSYKTFRLGVGRNNGVTKRGLMTFINRLKVSRSIEIGHINIADSHTLIELDGAYEGALLTAFGQNNFNGASLNAVVHTGRRDEGSYAEREKKYARRGNDREQGDSDSKPYRNWKDKPAGDKDRHYSKSTSERASTGRARTYAPKGSTSGKRAAGSSGKGYPKRDKTHKKDS